MKTATLCLFSINFVQYFNQIDNCQCISEHRFLRSAKIPKQRLTHQLFTSGLERRDFYSNFVNDPNIGIKRLVLLRCEVYFHPKKLLGADPKQGTTTATPQRILKLDLLSLT